MKKNIINFYFYLCILSILSIISCEYSQERYIDMSLEFFPKYTKRIVALKGKTNKTKCLALTDIKINDTLFKFDKDAILTSEDCFYPERKEAVKNISSYTNDTFTQNKMILSFCIFHLFKGNQPDELVPRKKKFLSLTIPINTTNMNHTEKLFDFPDLNEFLITGSTFNIEESDMIEKIIDRVLGIVERNHTDYILYSKIYYYITTHSFNLNGEAILIPFIDVCNIVPFYLNKPNLNYTNSSFIIEKNNKILIKAARNFKQNDQYLFSYNISLDNDHLMLKHGFFIHDNIYDTYWLNKKLSFKKNYESDELLNNLIQHNVNPKNFDYSKENNGYDLWMKFTLDAEKTNGLLYRFGLVYYMWRRSVSNDQNKKFRPIVKKALTFIMRLIYDELEVIESKMQTSYEEYLLKTQEDMKISDLNRKIREFNIEKMHFLNKNINYVYKDLVTFNYNEIKTFKNQYVMVDPNKDA